MLVYRVEHKKHRIGPYQTRCVCLDDKVQHDFSIKHPPFPEAFDEKEGLSRKGNMVFGFKNKYQAFKWFGYFGKKITNFLERKGFVLAVYSIDKSNTMIDAKDTQCVFLKDVATHVEDLKLSTIFDNSVLLEGAEA